MFRRFFKIGFGGCGCALEEHFRKHAVNLTCDLLNTHYLKDLEGWKNGLPEGHKFGIAPTVKRLDKMLKEGLTDTTFNKKLDDIAAELHMWQEFSEIVEKTGKPYEDVILENIRDIVKTMKKEVDETKNKGKILFESLPVDSFTETDAKGQPERFYVYNQYITETRELIVDQFGQVVIESQGFNHQPELQMLPFSIKEVRDEVFKNITKTIEAQKLKHSAIGGYLFFVGLGGGTGTGVISPLAEKFGKGSLGYFTVAVLGGKKDDDVLRAQKPWFRRCFNMLIALNDLIVTAELDGVILVDNNVIMKMKGVEESKDKMAEIDKKIIEELYPAFGITVLDGNDLDWSQLKEHIGLHALEKKPPVIVPCYASGDCSKSEDNLELLIEEALKDKDEVSGSDNGKLAPCKDFEKAKRVFVYVRCITDEKKVRDKLANVFREVSEENKYKNIAILKDYLFCWDDVKEGSDKELKSSLRNVCEIDWVDNAEPKGDHNGDKHELCNPKNKNEKIIIEIREERELFNWDDVVQQNDSELKKYLEDCKIEFDSISMFDDKKAITILDENENEVATIKLNEEETKATLEWDNKGNKEKRALKVKKEKWKKEKRKVYTPPEAELFTGKYLFSWDNVQQNDSELKKYLEDCKIEFDSISMSDDKKAITILDENENEVATITLYEEENRATLTPKGDGERDLKVKDRKIYDYLIKNVNKKVEDPELKVETVKSKRYVYLKKCQTTKNWIKNNVEKRIVVFESQEIGSFWHKRERKKNEVLILLFNPNVEEVLSDRLLEAKKFVDLLVRFKEVIEDRAKEGSKDKLEIAGQIIGQINKEQTVDADLNKKLKAIKLKEGIEEKDKPLPQAKDFLFPKELYDKDEGIYVHMVEILDRLKSEVDLIPEEGKDKDWWPIFKEEIFNIISTSGKRDEVILSAIEALEDQNKFNSLVGKGVYNTYFGIFKRQYFKYNARYLYPGVGEDILSDAAEQELPVALKIDINATSDREERITGDDLKVLVKNYSIKPVLLFSFSGDLTEEGIKKGFTDEGTTDEGKKKKIELSKDCIFVEGQYWFTWEKVNGAEEYIFRERLTNDCNLTWAKKAKIVMDKNAKIVVSKKEGSKKLELPIPDSGNRLTINSQQLEIKIDGSNHYIYKKNDDEFTIIDGAKIYSAQENGGMIDVYSSSELSYPAMLAVAGLYAEWEQVGSWPCDEEGKDAICQKLFGKPLSSVDFKIYELPKESGSKINIPNNSQILIIDADKEDATLVIRKADKDLFSWVAINKDEVSELNNKKIPQTLKRQFKDEQGMATEDYDDLKEANGGWLKLQPNPEAITNMKLYRCYYIKENAGKYSIDGDKIHNTLKVKKEEGTDGKTLKIYKKRGEKFEAAGVDGEAKIK